MQKQKLLYENLNHKVIKNDIRKQNLKSTESISNTN
jgi:hypothetical protein